MSFTLTLLGAAAFGLAYQSGTLLNGWRDRRSRERIQNDSQAFQGELEAKRQAFQAALAEKNFQQSAQLQREITAMKAAFDRQMQEARFEHDLEMWNMNQFVNNVWPLINTPDGYVHFLKQNGYPMSVIMTGKLDGGILSSASAFINEFYANHRQIYYYNQGWKENMLKRQGNAQRDALHQGLNGLPTLVVMPDIENGDFKLDVAFWGFGESMPQTVSVFKRNYQQMEAEILRNIAQENKNTVFPPISNPMILSIQAHRPAPQSLHSGRGDRGPVQPVFCLCLQKKRSGSRCRRRDLPDRGGVDLDHCGTVRRRLSSWNWLCAETAGSDEEVPEICAG